MLSKDIGIDLGTANVLIYVKGQGIVINEPSVVAIKVKGVFTRPRILICCPSNITQVERNAIREVAESAGAKKVYVEEEPKVAAVGAGLDISAPSASMVIDIGGGTTDIAILSLGDIVNSKSIRVAGDLFDTEIIKYVKNKYKLLIGERTSEDVKIKIGTVYPDAKKEKMLIRGRDMITGLPSSITISSKEVEEALHESIHKIVLATKSVLEETMPELSADIVTNGIVVTGGGALLNGLKKLLEEELKVPIKIADSPLTCVVDGTAVMLDNIKLLEK